jgi:cytoskeleton protein RodZ
VNTLSEDTLGDASGNVEERPFSVGTALREARERLGLSLADVERRLKFAPRQIEELEADNFTRLSEIFFVRRLVRSYAKLLQLDPEPLLAALPATSAQPSSGTTNVAIDVPFLNSYSKRRLRIIRLSVGLIAVSVAIIWGLFTWINSDKLVMPQAKVETIEMPVVVPANVSAVIPTQSSDTFDASSNVSVATTITPVDLSGTLDLSPSIRLVFDAAAWAKVTDRDGNVLLSQLNSSGSEQHLTGKPPFSVLIGNINGVHLYYHGKPVELAPFYNGEIARLKLE